MNANFCLNTNFGMNEPQFESNQPKRTRASRPKVRTGCLVCKERKLKCDEVKPTCTRCQRGLKKCAWMDLTAPRKEVVKPKQKTLLPRQPEQIIMQPYTNLFTNDKESWYFRVYSTETYQELSGAYQSNFWSHIVLQAAIHQPFIRNAIIAIGSFASQAKAAKMSPLRGINYHENPSAEEEFALEHYQRFLRGSRTMLSEDDQTTRLALITCLLIICIENLQWNHATSLNAVWSGTKLLNNWLLSYCAAGRPVSCITSPDPLAIEDGIIQQFKLVETQTSWLGDCQSVSVHEKLRRQGEVTIQGMTDSFSTVQEAKLRLDLIGRRVHHFIGSVRPEVLGTTGFSAPGEQRCFRITSDREQPFDPLTPEQVVIRQKYFEEIRKWEKAFARLSRSITADSPHFIAANLLRLHIRFFPILLFGKTSHTEMIYDKFNSNFQSIIDLAKAHFAHPSAQSRDVNSVCSLNNGLIFPLHTLIRRCRERTIRREGIELLLNNVWREGIHVSSSSGRIGMYVMELEERGVPWNEVIPEENRTVMFEMKYAELGDLRTASVKMARGAGKDRETLMEKWEWELEEVPWQDDQSTSVYSTVAEEHGNKVRGEELFEDKRKTSEQARMLLGMAAVVPMDWQTTPTKLSNRQRLDLRGILHLHGTGIYRNGP